MPANREMRLRVYRNVLQWGTGTKLLVAAGFAGLLALLSQVSVPLPWTPVPFTLQVFGVFLVGTMLGPRYALASMGFYLLAGALGLHVFAPSANSYNPDALWSADRWRILVPDLAAQTGYTAGYIYGFVAASAFVGSWMARRSQRLDGPLLWSVVGGLLALLVGISLAALFLAEEGTLAGRASGASYRADADLVWLFVGLAAIVLPAVAWLVRRRQGSEALNLYLVLMAAVALVHIPGLVVLKLAFGWSWPQAFALGSAVFLPMDALKAGLAVALSSAFVPSRSELERPG